MSDQLNLFPPTTSGDSPECISLQASLFGTTPSPLPDGPPTAPSGPAPALADPSPAPAKEPRKTIQGIFGQTSFASSKHEDLSASLASRYRRLTASLGSTLYEITWTQRITPSGFSIPAQRAQGRPTSAKGSIGALGWPTPNASNGSGGGQAARAGNPERSNELNDFAMLAGWPTPRATDRSNGDPNQANGALSADAAMCGWATPTKGDSANAANSTCTRSNPDSQHHDGWTLIDQARLTGWATPKASDGDGGRTTMTKGGGNAHLQIETRLAGWPTPMAGTPAQNGNNAAGNTDSSRLTEALCRWPVPSTASGEGPIGFIREHSGTVICRAGGQLCPRHSAWLMSIPEIWCRCAIRASRSLKAKKRASSGSKDTVTGS